MDSGSASSVEAGAPDGTPVIDATIAPPDADALPSADDDAGEGELEAAGATCDLAACPVNSCNITVYFRACCLADGGCGCSSTVPSPGPCMAQ